MTSISAQVVGWVSNIEKFRKKDKRCSELMSRIKDIGNRMTDLYQKIHNETYSSQEEFNEITFEISKLAEERRNKEKEYKSIMEAEFGEFKEKYENIYELAISEDGVDRGTLTNALNVYELYNKQQININQGTNMGLKYTQKKFNMPENFFNYLPTDEN